MPGQPKPSWDPNADSQAIVKAHCEALSEFKTQFDAAKPIVSPKLASAVRAEEIQRAKEKAARLAMVQTMVRENQVIPRRAIRPP